MIDVVVVGSGYGGSVVAARLAPRCRVLVVERGRRWRSGEFPEGMAGLARSLMTKKNPGGLWGMRLGAGTGNAYASAWGGSSVVNYGITARPDDHALAGWPLSVAELEPYFERAEGVLRPQENPVADGLGDRQFLDLVEPGRRVDLRNTIDWRLCTQCGRCVPGCNQGAKRALDDSYLALATRAGAQVKLETEVRRVALQDDGTWAVELRERRPHGAAEVVRARHVVLAAGTLGTLDLLFRMRESMPLSAVLGQRMSMNGDGLAFLYNLRHRLSSDSGAPISTSVRIPFAGKDGATRTLTVMSGRVPMAAMRFAGAALSLVSGRFGHDPTPPKGAEKWRRHWRRLRDLTRVDGRGALSHTFMYKLDGQDESAGIARLTDAGTVIDWPDYADDPVLRFAEERLRGWAKKVGGTVVPNIARLPGMRSFSVHPLGGAGMATTPETGVVDATGRVFRPEGGIYPGLRIADGSIMAGSLGVPPSLTICAIAERIAEDLAGEISSSRASGGEASPRG